MIELPLPVMKHFDFLLFEDKDTKLTGEKRKAKLTGNDQSAYCDYGNARGARYLRELVNEEREGYVQRGEAPPEDMLAVIGNLNNNHTNDILETALHLWRESPYALHTNILTRLETDMYRVLWKDKEMELT